MAIPDLLLHNGSWIWEGFYTEQSTLIYFCETVIPNAFIRQPADTYSNLGFLFVGVVMLVFARQDRRQSPRLFLQQHPIWSYLYAAALIATFLCSGFFHASLSRFAEWLDLAAVFASVWIPVCFCFHRLYSHHRKRSGPVVPWLSLYFVLLLLSCLSIFRINAWWTFPAAILLVGLSSAWLQSAGRFPGGWKWVVASILMTLFAAMWFIFDIRRILCDSESWLQPHALWHLFDAAAAGCFYGFMRTVPREHA